MGSAAEGGREGRLLLLQLAVMRDYCFLHRWGMRN